MRGGRYRPGSCIIYSKATAGWWSSYTPAGGEGPSRDSSPGKLEPKGTLVDTERASRDAGPKVQ